MLDSSFSFIEVFFFARLEEELFLLSNIFIISEFLPPEDGIDLSLFSISSEAFSLSTSFDPYFSMLETRYT